jgi:hypothetical protein
MHTITDRKGKIMNYDTYIGSRMDSHRAATLAHENELLRSHADRGVTVSPQRPVVKLLHSLSEWWAAVAPSIHGRPTSAQH